MNISKKLAVGFMAVCLAVASQVEASANGGGNGKPVITTGPVAPRFTRAPHLGIRRQFSDLGEFTSGKLNREVFTAPAETAATGTQGTWSIDQYGESSHRSAVGLSAIVLMATGIALDRYVFPLISARWHKESKLQRAKAKLDKETAELTTEATKFVGSITTATLNVNKPELTAAQGWLTSKLSTFTGDCKTAAEAALAKLKKTQEECSKAVAPVVAPPAPAKR